VRALLVSIGNVLRQDDGVANRVLDLLGEVQGVAIRRTMQLTPEIAAELESYPEVVFIDADVEVNHVELTPVPAASSRTPLSHAMSTTEVIRVAERLYGFRGSAWLCRVPGREFGPGEGLSAEAEAHARVAAQSIEKWLSERGFTTA
jgi:hydrogenase maturation protease